MPRQKSDHVDSPEAVGRRIREARERLGLRQADLAFPGCTGAYISRIEAGARIPSLQVLRELGRRLGVPVDVLATGEAAADEQRLLTDARLAQRLGDHDLAREGFATLRESGDATLRAGALQGLGELALLEGETATAIELLEERERVAGDHAPVEAAAVEALARAYAIRSDLAAALALLERKLELAQDDPLAGFRLSIMLANTLIDLGQLDRAETVIGDVLGGLGAAPDPIAFARSLWSQSRLQTARGNNDLAARYAEEALNVIRATEHDEYAARAHHLLAYIELERGEPARALELLRGARPLLERVGDQHHLALFSVEEARALVALGEHDEARALASSLVTEVEQLSNVDAARALSVLAEVFAKAGDTTRALELYEAAADTLAGGDDPMLVDLYTKWSDLLAETGDTGQALEVARRALTARQGARL